MKITLNKKLSISLIVTFISSLCLGLVIYNGKYFQNLINSPYFSQSLIFILLKWLLISMIFGFVFYNILIMNKNRYVCLWLIVAVYISISSCLISKYCFTSYTIALISCLFSVIFLIILSIILWKNKQIFTFILLLFILYYLILCLYTCIIDYSITYGKWKD